MIVEVCHFYHPPQLPPALQKWLQFSKALCHHFLLIRHPHSRKSLGCFYVWRARYYNFKSDSSMLICFTISKVRYLFQCRFSSLYSDVKLYIRRLAKSIYIKTRFLMGYAISKFKRKLLEARNFVFCTSVFKLFT